MLHVTEGIDAAIAIGLLGVLWGTLYIKRGSSIAPIVNHAGFDALQVLQVVLDARLLGLTRFSNQRRAVVGRSKRKKAEGRSQNEEGRSEERAIACHQNSLKIEASQRQFVPPFFLLTSRLLPSAFFLRPPPPRATELDDALGELPHNPRTRAQRLDPCGDGRVALRGGELRADVGLDGRVVNGGGSAVASRVARGVIAEPGDHLVAAGGCAAEPLQFSCASMRAESRNQASRFASDMPASTRRAGRFVPGGQDAAQRSRRAVTSATGGSTTG